MASVTEILESRILSQSSINYFYSCRRKFKLAYIDKKYGEHEYGDAQGFDFSWLGMVIHRVLEDFYKPEHFPCEEDLDRDAKNKIEAVLISILDKHWEYGQPQHHLINAKSMLNLFSIREAKRWEEQGHDPTMNFVPQFREYKLEDTDSLRLQAIIDVVWVDKAGRVRPHPRDYKTNKKPEITQPMKMQALVTSMLINNAFEEMPTHFEFLFLRTNKSLLYEITPERINKAIEKIEFMWKEIEEKHFMKNLKECYWCPVKVYCEGGNRCWL